MSEIPKTRKDYKKSFNIRISEAEKEKWENYTKEKNYSSVSHMIRSTINERIDGILQPSHQNSEILNRMKVLEDENKDLLKDQKEILKIIALKSTVQTDTTTLDFQKEIILNLLREKPRNEKELASLLGLNQVDILVLLNDLLEMSIIKRSEKAKTKFEVVL